MTRTRSQASKYSLRKFKALERRVAKELREWTSFDGFRRTPGSGGFNKAYKTKVGEKEFASDIMCERPMKFTIEVKSEEGFSLDAVMDPATVKTTKFSKWWFQVCNDAEHVEKLPLLWFKPIPNWDWIALCSTGVEELGLSMRVGNIQQPTMRICLEGYNPSVTGPVHEPCGDKTEKTINLPKPYIFRWKDIKADVDGQLLFDGD